MSRVINLFLRVLTLLSKFLIVVFLARFLSPESVGLYGLFVVTISYTLYLLGFDFYTFSSRDILKHDQTIWGRLFKSQLVFFCLTYLIVLPLSLLLFFNGYLPFEYVFYFLLLLVLEHINQEFSRLLIVLSEQLYASIALFFRSGLWCLLVMTWMWLSPESRELHTVFVFWIGGGVLAALIGVWRCYSLRVSGWRDSVDWSWIKRGLSVAIPLLISTLALRGIFTLDRYLFESLVSLEILGAYTLFMGLGNALMSFLDAGVFMYAYPKLIRLHKEQNYIEFSKEMKQLAVLTVGFCVVFAIGSSIVLPIILQWLGNAVYVHNQNLFWSLLLVMTLYAVSMVPHYGLYARDKDKPLIYTHIIGFTVFIFSVYLISKYNEFWAVPFSLNIAFLIIFIMKMWAYWRISRLRGKSAKINVEWQQRNLS